MNRHTLGILAGGQLGRMMINEAKKLDLTIRILDPDPAAPCANMGVDFVVGDVQDENTVYEWGQGCERITIELENVNVKALKRLRDEGTYIVPRPEILEMIQDKGLQKQFYTQQELPTSAYRMVDSEQAITEADLPCVQKLRTGGYDGKGVKILRTAADLEQALVGPSVIEQLVDIQKEIAVIAARDEQGKVALYDPVEMLFDPVANLVTRLAAPAAITTEQRERALHYAQTLMIDLDMVGILAVEFFIDQQGQVLINEMAPRAHNSGHHSIEGCATSQFMQLVRCAMGFPVGDTRLIEPSIMLNLLGEPGYEGLPAYEGLDQALGIEGVSVHIYGKKRTYPMRKMGHITVTAPTLEQAHKRADRVQALLRVVSR